MDIEDAIALEAEIVDMSTRLWAIGAANKWLTSSMRRKDVALLLRRCEDPGPGREWMAVLYTGDEPVPRTRYSARTSEWTGTHWQTALTHAVQELLSDEMMRIVERRADTSWFMFEDIYGREVKP